MCVYIYIYIEREMHTIIIIIILGCPIASRRSWCWNAYRKHQSENIFAIFFLLEIPLRGFPFQMISLFDYRVPKNNPNIMLQRISFEEETPSGGSLAGNISQTSSPNQYIADLFNRTYVLQIKAHSEPRLVT